MTTEELANQIQQLAAALVVLRRESSRLSKVPLRLAALKDAIRDNKRLSAAATRQYCEAGYAIDLTTLSVLPCKANKSRYLRNSEGYHNDLNLIAAWSTSSSRGYAAFTDNTQITRAALNGLAFVMSRLEGARPVFYTDNRHRCAVRMPKSRTQVIERRFSVVKRKVYRELKPRQTWRGRELWTDISREDFIRMYQKAFASEGFQIVA